MIATAIRNLNELLLGTPTALFIVVSGLFLTNMLRYVQFRSFFQSWKILLTGGLANKKDASSDMSTFQAFLNALSISIGNGMIGGVASAIYVGGPGAAFWVFFVGLIGMVIRYAEVFLSLSFIPKNFSKADLGGPFVYIKRAPFGNFLVLCYTIMCLMYGLVGGNAMQCNSIALAINKTFMTPQWIVGAVMTCFAAYVLLGGAQRIIKLSVFIVPIKVSLFFLSIIFVFIYHWANIIPAMVLIVKSAFNPQAFVGGAVGLTIMKVFCRSAVRVINASEAGLGTAAIFYGSTDGKNRENDSLSSMLTVFIGNNIVICLLALALVASGAWNSGYQSSAMTAHAFASAMGQFGNIVVSVLAVCFGLGVFVAYGYISRQCWLYLTNDRFEWLFILLFSSSSFVGAIVSASDVFDILDCIVVILFFINMFALMYFSPYIRKNMIL